jgi:hypothetical protein
MTKIGKLYEERLESMNQGEFKVDENATGR